MTDDRHTSSTDIDVAAAKFCVVLTQLCSVPNDKAFANWSASDSVDRLEPVGLRSGVLRDSLPNRTFRYGMPQFIRPRPHISFSVSKNRSSAFRTPIEQAREVAANRSWVCWGAHMSDKARHVIPKLEGQSYVDGDKFEEDLGQHLPWFITLWKEALRTCDLRDAKGEQNWYAKDQLHVELPDSKIPLTDARASVCVDEYVRLVNEGTGRRNHKFEAVLPPQLRNRLHSLAGH